MTSYSVDKAVEITKAAIPMQAGTWISNPEAVAKFIEAVAAKIDQLVTKK